ncbi:Uma2 family endonuclease (plasmid) [Kitasatospora sp. NBC_00070]|uniref:Uma2 family endonuclease n=1 Tax=Kitasatospora sp. NBC_00070 TaxID=2975962 RepID=UPI002F919042
MDPVVAQDPVGYTDGGPEQALKRAVRDYATSRAELVEGIITLTLPSRAHQKAVKLMRRQIMPCLAGLGLAPGTGYLDLPGSDNWFMPDLTVSSAGQAEEERTPVTDRTLLVVEVTSSSSAETDRVVKLRWYGRYKVPLYLLVDRQRRSCTVFSEPGKPGYEAVDGPHPFGTPIRLPAPFGLTLDTRVLPSVNRAAR